MSARDLTPERRNELEQWASLGHSATALARMYGVSDDTVHRIRRALKAGKPAFGKPGRYPAVPAETVEAIADELRRDAKHGRRAKLARRYGFHKSVVTRIALAAGIEKCPAGRKTRHNRKTMDRLAEYFADV